MKRTIWHERAIPVAKRRGQTTVMSFLDALGILGEVAPRLTGLSIVAFMVLWLVDPALGERLFIAVVEQAARQAADLVIHATSA